MEERATEITGTEEARRLPITKAVEEAEGWSRVQALLATALSPIQGKPVWWSAPLAVTTCPCVRFVPCH